MRASDMPSAIGDLRSEFNAFNAGWDTLQDTIWPFDKMAQMLTWIPRYGDDLAVSIRLIKVIDKLLQSIIMLEHVFDPLLSMSSDELLTNQSLLDAALIVDGSLETIAEINTLLAQTTMLLDTIEIDVPVHPVLEQVVAQAQLAVPALHFIVEGLQALPDAVGIDKPHHILVLIQNADEIRPTGGFITAVAYITIEQASVQEITFLQSSDPSIDRYDRYYQYETPPYPFVEYMDSHLWIFRDSNWSPDFPTSASKAAELFTLGTQMPIDTVAAINQFTIQDLLSETGPIRLRDGGVVNQENFLAVTKESWAINTARLGRKHITEELGLLILERLESLSSPAQFISLFNTISAIGAEKNLYAYSGVQSIQRLFQLSNIDGSIPLSKGDYLFIVDFNVGYDKVGVNIQKDFDYQVNLRQLSRPYAILNTRHTNVAAASLDGCPKTDSNYENNTYDSRIIDCYGNYLRIYLPNSSEVHLAPQFIIPASYDLVSDSAAGQMSPIPDERGKEVLAGLQVVPPGQTVTGRFVYELDPKEIFSIQSQNSLHYSLLLQKQSGIPAYDIEIIVQLPDDVNITEILPKPEAIDHNTILFAQRFDRDISIEIDFVLSDEMNNEIRSVLDIGEKTSMADLIRFVPTLPPRQNLPIERH